MFPTPWDFKEILNVVYVSVVCNFAARKCHHCCSVNVTMLVLLYVAVIVLNVVHVSVIVCNVVASKCPHWCSINVAMLPLLYVAVIVCKSCVCVCHCMQCCKCHHCGGVTSCYNYAMKLLLYVAATHFIGTSLSKPHHMTSTLKSFFLLAWYVVP